MRILHIHWTLATGGTETMLVDIVNEQCNEHQVSIMVVNSMIDENLVARISPKVKIIRINRTPGSKNPIPLLQMNMYIRLHKIDIIHVHSQGIVPYIRTFTPIIRTIHSTIYTPEEYHRYKKLCCISESVKKHTASQGFPNSVIVYNGIHTSQIPPRTTPLTTDGIRKIICVGRLEKVKGQQILIEAIRILVNERGVKNLHLTIIGDGTLRTQIESSLQNNALTEYVSLLGTKPRSYFYPLLKDFDLFVLPSLSEGFGLTLAEACAAKIPVMTCDLEGPMEVIANGKYGTTFKTANPFSLADALEKFLTGTPDSEQVEAAYRFTQENFDVKKTAQNYVEIYRNVLQHK